MIYKASLDKQAIAISTIINIVFFFTVIFTSVIFSEENNPIQRNDFSMIMLGFVLLASFLIAWLLHPIRYETTPDAVLIKRPVKQVTINKNEIESVRLLEKNEIPGITNSANTTRRLGSGGFLGYFGIFSNHHLGRMTWFVTNRNNMVLLKMRDRKIYVVSPDDTSTFIKEFGKSGNG